MQQVRRVDASMASGATLSGSGGRKPSEIFPGGRLVSVFFLAGTSKEASHSCLAASRN